MNAERGEDIFEATARRRPYILKRGSKEIFKKPRGQLIEKVMNRNRTGRKHSKMIYLQVV